MEFRSVVVAVADSVDCTAAAVAAAVVGGWGNIAPCAAEGDLLVDDGGIPLFILFLQRARL